LIRPDLHTRCGLLAHEFDRVVDQVLKDFQEPHAISLHDRHRLVDHHGDAPLLDLPIDERLRLAGQFGQVDGLGRVDQTPDAGEI